MTAHHDLTTPSTTPITTERRAELLAQAARASLIQLAEECLADGAAPTVVRQPEVGMVMMTVREPIAQERFHLGEVLVTRAEVSLDGHRGWSMRLGDDTTAALAAAVLDAVAAAGTEHADAVEELCRLTDAAIRSADEAEWDDLAPTQVRFDELD